LLGLKPEAEGWRRQNILSYAKGDEVTPKRQKPRSGRGRIHKTHFTCPKQKSKAQLPRRPAPNTHSALVHQTKVAKGKKEGKKALRRDSGGRDLQIHAGLLLKERARRPNTCPIRPSSPLHLPKSGPEVEKRGEMKKFGTRTCSR